MSELEFITVEAATAGQVMVSCKGKTRAVFIVDDLKKAAAIRQGKAYRGRTDLYYSRREDYQPHEYLARDESTMQRRQRQPQQGISA